MKVAHLLFLAGTMSAIASSTDKLAFLMPDPGVFGRSNDLFARIAIARSNLLQGQSSYPLARIIVVGAPIPDYSITIYQKSNDNDIIE